ncbi:MAG: DUF459 domain-containing protein, partial [Rhodoplanes sp.]|nr:DUF459 domain-containing protein [Rhodoplanes sp.]
AKPDPRKPVAGVPDEAPPAEGAETQAQTTGSGSHEFRSERWSELYIRRIDETIAALKSKGVPVFWVGLPPVRGARSTADFSYLNDLFRSRAERAGIVYVDVWDGFVDEGGRFTMQGPDVEGQIRRLRAGDGVHFTQAGARKLAHYVERELQRWMTARATPVALPVEEPAKTPEPAKPGTGPATASPAGTARPLAGPVITLSGVPIPAEGDEQLVGGTRQTQTAALDVVAAKVIQKGEAIPAPAGRADDFAWPRREPAAVGADPVVAYTTLPMTPMKAERQMMADAPAAAAPAAAAGPPKPAGPTAPRVARVQPQQQQQPQVFGWFGQPYRPAQPQYQQQVRQAPQRPTFFPFLFGGGR